MWTEGLVAIVLIGTWNTNKKNFINLAIFNFVQLNCSIQIHINLNMTSLCREIWKLIVRRYFVGLLDVLPFYTDKIPKSKHFQGS